MNAVKEDVIKLVDKELKSANERFSLFRSAHEGYAVIKEEIEEAEEQLGFVKQMQDALWNNIKCDNEQYTIRFCEEMKRCAINGVTELIQVAAMAQKFIDSAKEWDK